MTEKSEQIVSAIRNIRFIADENAKAAAQKSVGPLSRGQESHVAAYKQGYADGAGAAFQAAAEIEYGKATEEAS